MCGRYTVRNPKKITTTFDVSLPEGLFPRFNIAPTQEVPVVRVAPAEGKRELVLLRWGLVPSWAKGPEIGNRLINARAETVAEKPSFRSAFKTRRCLLPADGFFEWQATNGKKQPYYITPKDGGLFAFAGLWERWHDKESDKVIETCTILTTEANALMRPIHERMPVILQPGDYSQWLSPAEPRPKAQLLSMIRPYPPEAMVAHPVSTRVNNPRNDEPECIAPLAGR